MDNAIHVSNLGTVDRAISDLDAQRIFKAYCKTVHDSAGRAAWETVTWFKDGDIYKEYIPTLRVCFEGDGQDWHGVAIGLHATPSPFLWVQIAQVGTRRVAASCQLPARYWAESLHSSDPSIARNCHQQIEGHKSYHRTKMLSEEEMAAIALALLLPWEWPATYQEVGRPDPEPDDEEEAVRNLRIWDCVTGARLSTKIPPFAVYRRREGPGTDWGWQPLGLPEVSPAL